MGSAIVTRSVRRGVLMAATSSVAFVLAGLGARTIVRASDHLDGPRATIDRQADITDVFAFTSPENAAHVVLAMGVTPYATDVSTFSSGVDYVFRIRRVAALAPLTLDPDVLDVTCEFDDGAADGGDGGIVNVTCTAPGGLASTIALGQTTGGGDATSRMRVFAGPRSDPAFFDRAGALATLASGRYSFTGANAFAGANVLAIVVELDASVFSPPATDAGPRVTSPTIAVAAETVRRVH